MHNLDVAIGANFIIFSQCLVKSALDTVLKTRLILLTFTRNY